MGGAQCKWIREPFVCYCSSNRHIRPVITLQSWRRRIDAAQQQQQQEEEEEQEEEGDNAFALEDALLIARLLFRSTSDEKCCGDWSSAILSPCGELPLTDMTLVGVKVAKVRGEV